MTTPMTPLCKQCYEPFSAKRRKLGYTLCLTCGDGEAKKVRHTIAPLAKSNYFFISDPETLKQLNPKRTT
jgi:PHP family Zn ribbon phosphoesterase